MAGRQKLGEKFSVVLTEDLAALVEDVKRATGEETAPLLRKAIRAGLPLVKSGGAADVLTLDSELSRDVDAMAKAYKRTRNAILIEAIQKGARAVNVRGMYENAEHLSPEQAEMMIKTHPEVEPHLREVRVAKIAKGALQIQMDDLLRHVPEAKRRADAIEKLTAIRREPGGMGGGPPWGCGLSTEEIEWQIAMREKHGLDSNKWPKAEIEKRQARRAELDAARARESATTSPAPKPKREPKPAKKKSRK